MSNKYTIGVKAKFALGANVIKYDGKCYYRIDQQGGTNAVPTSACTRFYPIDPCFHTHSLTGKPLLCYNCEKGEYEFRPNTVFEVPDIDDTLQFRFVPLKDRDYGMFKFMVGNTFFTKNLELSGKYLVFDPNGEHEHIFDAGVYPYTINFSKNSNNYCLKYAGPGSYVFTLSIESADTADLTIPSTGIGTSPLSPTPTPTAYTGTGAPPSLAGGPSGTSYYRSVSWPSSGTQILSMWFDTSEPDTIQLLPGMSKMDTWTDRSDNQYELIAPQIDSGMDAATKIRSPGFISSGGIGGGPGITFSVDSTNGGRFMVLQDNNLDHRAVFIVGTYEGKITNGFQRGKGIQGLMTGATNQGGPEACNGNMFVIPDKGAWWNVVDAGAASIFSDKGASGQDAGQYYIYGAPLGDKELVIKGDYAPGALWEGIRTTGTSPKVDGLCIGSELALASGDQRGWNGKIGEIIILDDEPSDRLREEIEGYLCWKWGLVDHLPIGHTWKEVPPIELDPTPTPMPPPTPTPTEPVPPLPRGVPVGTNLVTTTQLIDVISQRTYPATLWPGGHYQSDWELIKTRLDVLSNNTLTEAITSSIVTTISAMKVPTPDIKGTWRSALYEQDDIDCGVDKDTIRLGYPSTVIDDADNRIMYCVNRIEVSDSINFGKSLYDVTKNAPVPMNPDPTGSPYMWNLLVNTLRSVDAKAGEATTRYTSNEFDSALRVLEKSAQLPLLIETPGFSYNILDDLQTPLTTLYQLPGDHTASPHSNTITPLYLSDQTSRVDIATELMLHEGSLLLWQKPIQIGDEATLEVTVDFPGASADRSTYTNLQGPLPWKINIEIVDKSDNTAIYKSLHTQLPTSPQLYIPNTSVSIVIAEIAGRSYKITPYLGDYKASSSEQLYQQALAGNLPVLFLRIDRV